MPTEDSKANSQAQLAVQCIASLAETLRDKYTYCQPVCVDGEPDAHTVWIKIGVQSFRIDGYQETKDGAEWMRLMLGKAFAALVSANAPGDRRRADDVGLG